MKTFAYTNDDITAFTGLMNNENLSLYFRYKNVHIINKKIDNFVLDSNLIIIHQHDQSGLFEKECIRFLQREKWYGILMLTNIKIGNNPQMWQKINQKKMDLSELSHDKIGVGIVFF